MTQQRLSPLDIEKQKKGGKTSHLITNFIRKQENNTSMYIPTAISTLASLTFEVSPSGMKSTVIALNYYEKIKKGKHVHYI
jgi:hypothetical protein